MTGSIQLPVWLFILILAFAGVTFASHFLFPSVRWFLRRRAEKVVARLNERLTRPIEPFKLLRRQDMIQRLVYDPQVIEAVAEHARENNVREDVAFETANRYAREIVPSFSATAYFGFAIKVARLLARAFYRVEAAPISAEVKQALASDAAVVFVINHRSNMDYVLVTYLAAERSALSFAAGEWARVWPLGALVRAMGAYFVRRKSRNPLYRRVMARYVQMATQGGVAQAIFPEGGLSLDGKVGMPKLGLLSYIVQDFDSEASRDVIFVPVALNYDRVMEDRVLVKAAQNVKRRFRFRWRSAVRYFFRHAVQRLTGRFLKFGYAAVTYGEPLSLRAFKAEHDPDLITDLGRELMSRIRSTVPITPIPVLAKLLKNASLPIAKDELVARLEAQLNSLVETHSDMIALTEPTNIEAAYAVRHLMMRKMITETPQGIAVVPGNDALIDYYVNSIDSCLDAPAAKQ